MYVGGFLGPHPTKIVPFHKNTCNRMLSGTFWAEQQKYTSPIFKRTMVK